MKVLLLRKYCSISLLFPEIAEVQKAIFFFVSGFHKTEVCAVGNVLNYSVFSVTRICHVYGLRNFLQFPKFFV